jgi:rhodanese-related sulfurtransferase
MKDLFLNLGIISGGVLNLSPGETYKNCMENNAVIIDLREDYISAFKTFDVPECIPFPFEKLKRSGEQLPKNRLLIMADSSGIYGREAVLYLREIGFITVANMSGGLVEWERTNLPLIIDTSNRLSGSCMCQLKYRDNKNTKS